MFEQTRKYLEVLGPPGVFRLLQATLTRSVVSYAVERDDCAPPIYLRIPSSDVSTYRQIFMRGEYAFAGDLRPQVIVDAGANIGLASIYFAIRYPDARIIALEPEESNFRQLEMNVAKHERITPVQAALWYRDDEELNLIHTGRGKWGFQTEPPGSPKRKKGTVRHTVRAVTVDSLMNEHNLARIDLLKMDIEGAEREVFADTASWIDRVDSLVVELHERLKPGCNRSFYLGSRGFSTEWTQGEKVCLSRGMLLPERSR